MFQILQGTQVLAECSDLQQAAEALLEQNMGAGPRVVANGETVIEVAWRYIPGDCYEPSGYAAYTADARLALHCATAMQGVQSLIGRLASDAMAQLKGLSFQASSSQGLVDVRLAWAEWPGFTLEIRTADKGYIVYSPWLDEALGGKYGCERVTPTLGYFIDKAAEFGIELPSDKVELIRSRSHLND